MSDKLKNELKNINYYIETEPNLEILDLGLSAKSWKELLGYIDTLEDYKQRNERAIDYIEYEYEQNIIITDYADNPITPQEEYGELLNILKGDKDE